MTRDKLVQWFIENEHEKYLEMVNSMHTVDLKFPNIFHAENQVFTHTLMVMTWIEAQKEKYSENDYIKLITTALLHDTGKPNTQETMPANEDKPIRNSFKGHEGVSTFFAVGVLKKLQKDFPEIYSEEIIKDIIKLISTHGVHIDETTELKELKEAFRQADKNGAVRLVTEKKFEQYEPRKYLKPTMKTDSKLVLLCGLPNSGKSTARKELNKFGEYFILSRDDLLETFYEAKTGKVDSYNTMYKYIHNDKDILKEFEGVFAKQIEQARKYKNVLVDMTLLSLSSRRKMLNNFPKFKAEIIVVMTDNDELFKRNKKRFEETNKFISEKVIENMMTSFVFPVKEEGFENIEFIIN